MGFFILFLLFIAAHIYLGLRAIDAQSATYDEPVHAVAGYAYLKTGDYRYNGYHHPALSEMWAALPWLVLKPLFPFHDPVWLKQQWDALSQYRFAAKVLYQNRISHELLLNSARMMQLFLSVILGLILFWAGWEKGGPWAGIITAAFWAFS